MPDGCYGNSRAPGFSRVAATDMVTPGFNRGQGAARLPEPQAKPPGWATLFCMMSSQATNCTRPAKPHLHTNNPQRKQPRQVPKIWQGCLFYLTRNEAIVRAQITNLRQRERSAQLIGFLSVLLAFSSLSLFVVTKRFQKRADKRNSLRLRLRSDSLLSQWPIVLLVSETVPERSRRAFK